MTEAEYEQERVNALWTKIGRLSELRGDYVNARSQVQIVRSRLQSEKASWDSISTNLDIAIAEIVKDKMFTGEIANQFKAYASELAGTIHNGSDSAGILENSLTAQIERLDERINGISEEIQYLRGLI